MNGMELYLKPTEFINSEHQAIQDIAAELSRNCTNWVEKAGSVFYFVRDSIQYSIYMISMYPEDFKASNVLTWRKGYCVQKAVLLAALGRAIGIPTRLSFAKIRNHRVPAQLIERTGTNIFPRHGYNQFYLEGKWVSVAATFDRELCDRNGLTAVEFNGVNDAVLPKTDLNGNPYIEYLEMYESQADLPLKWITEETSKIWGPEKKAWLSKEHAKRFTKP